VDLQKKKKTFIYVAAPEEIERRARNHRKIERRRSTKKCLHQDGGKKNVGRGPHSQTIKGGKNYGAGEEKEEKIDKMDKGKPRTV